jgi:hypothetical protein
MKKDEKLRTEYVIFSKNEIEIINTVVNTVHNDKNTIYLSGTFYISALLVRESMINSIIKSLKDKHGVDNDIIQSFYKNNSIENLMKNNKIDKNNIFNFYFNWYKYSFEDKNDLLNKYEKISVSKIGFNENQTKALIFLEMDREIKGFGNFYLLDKETEKWVICKTIEIYDRIRVTDIK